MASTAEKPASPPADPPDRGRPGLKVSYAAATGRKTAWTGRGVDVGPPAFSSRENAFLVRDASTKTADRAAIVQALVRMMDREAQKALCVTEENGFFVVSTSSVDLADKLAESRLSVGKVTYALERLPTPATTATCEVLLRGVDPFDKSFIEALRVRLETYGRVLTLRPNVVRGTMIWDGTAVAVLDVGEATTIPPARFSVESERDVPAYEVSVHITARSPVFCTYCKAYGHSRSACANPSLQPCTGCGLKTHKSGMCKAGGGQQAAASAKRARNGKPKPAETTGTAHAPAASGWGTGNEPVPSLASLAGPDSQANTSNARGERGHKKSFSVPSEVGASPSVLSEAIEMNTAPVPSGSQSWDSGFVAQPTVSPVAPAPPVIVERGYASFRRAYEGVIDSGIAVLPEPGPNEQVKWGGPDVFAQNEAELSRGKIARITEAVVIEQGVPESRARAFVRSLFGIDSVLDQLSQQWCEQKPDGEMELREYASFVGGVTLEFIRIMDLSMATDWTDARVRFATEVAYTQICVDDAAADADADEMVDGSCSATVAPSTAATNASPK